ncbi:MAG: hypothetical protein ACKVX7_10815 [Planctomycetota bacterium]
MRAPWLVAALLLLVVGGGCRTVAVKPSAPISTVATAALPVQRTADELLDRCVRHYDPHGNWPRAIFRLELEEQRLAGVRHTTVIVNNRSGDFHCLTVVDDVPVVIFRKAGKLGARLREREGGTRDMSAHGASASSNDDSEAERVEFARIGLTPERLAARSRYYLQLIGLPMNLRAGAWRVAHEVTRERFAGHDVDAIELRDDSVAARERWVFLLDAETGALRGGRFFASADSTTSEVLSFTGETELCGMRIPTTRSWFSAPTNSALGVDTIVAVQKLGD